MSDKSITASKIIEMAWCDKTSFDSIKNITGLSEPQVIKIMQNNLKPSSFRLWRKRVSGRVAKHHKKLNYTNASSLV
ncbi:TIGR03643 family protein [Francisella noatunensis]|uniref:TIGR03643 family protein n=1 Tax=Francisella noatunensis TaxID=657445 RepID=A0A9Q2KY64_9GAMM|nr:TIGR03643 family protein [Francisella noatunensis]MBK2029134.1 TIGR03643 family protein [Francisella noatunensis]MBK2033740.1 TIGR03643 family protein [Francisella noatunensis]MBK2048335.1 TIGR03643 family protein [Francisella noatunensis]MBK2049757.1 TIGR03643 family protein [Francisella noatunensis]MBK2051725.1 TIGR03643 family protein [Francisella noatunensis]